MAHLEKRPTYFVKGNERRAAYFSVQAREWREQGFVEEDEKATIASDHKPSPERPVVAGGDGFSNLPVDHETEDLDSMTKVELLEYAFERGVDLKNALPKAEVLAACRKLKEAEESELEREEIAEDLDAAVEDELEIEE